jgi:4-hydroxy-3-methylbut-2-en-1-yl diphosphate reductase
MIVVMASKYGFCMGVKRALGIVKGVSGGATVLHQIVHNPSVSLRIKKLGIQEVEDINQVKTKSVIFSAHGVSPQVRLKAENLKLKMIDATCPLVLKVHGIVKSYAMRGYEFIYVGHKGHPEPIGVVGEAPGKVYLIEKINEVYDLRFMNEEKLVVVTQTTLSVEDTEEIIEMIKKRYPKAIIFNTICMETSERQRALAEILDKVDMVIVVGGRNSSNSQRLVDLAKKKVPAFLVESDKELEKGWFKGIKVVGLTAGASTPEEETMKVKKWIEKIS